MTRSMKHCRQVQHPRKIRRMRGRHASAAMSLAVAAAFGVWLHAQAPAAPPAPAAQGRGIQANEHPPLPIGSALP